jgi:hypothetical protein
MSLTQPLSKESQHHAICNLGSVNHTVRFTELQDIIRRAKSSVNELESKFHRADINPEMDLPTMTIQVFWLITNFIAHDFINIIENFVNLARSYKQTDIFTKLECDFITMHLLLTMQLSILESKVALFRMLDSKKLDHHMPQLDRLMTVILDQSEHLNLTVHSYMQHFIAAMGSSKSSRDFTEHLEKVTTMSSLHTKLVRSFRRVLLSGPVQNVRHFLVSSQGHKIVHWISNAAKLVLPEFIPNTCEQLLTTLVEKCPLPIDYSQPSIEVETPAKCVEGSMPKEHGLRTLARPQVRDSRSDLI